MITKVEKRLVCVLVSILVLFSTSCGTEEYGEYSEQVENGANYMAKQQYGEAIESYETILQSEPKSVEAYLGISECYEEMGEYVSAAQTLMFGYVNVNAHDKETIKEKFDELTSSYEEIQNALDRGKQPILAGGTGLYIDAVLNNTSFGDFECPPDIRTRLNEEAKALGAEELHRRLASVDPEAASEIHPNNLKRVVRALEVYEATGNTITYYKSISRNTPPPFTFSHFTLVCEDRERLYDRINRRVDIMIEHGLVEEAHLLYTSGFEQAVTASQAIAYKELFGYFKGEMSLEESVELLKQKTRNYAKRQLTWFSRYDAVRLEIQ